MVILLIVGAVICFLLLGSELSKMVLGSLGIMILSVAVALFSGLGLIFIGLAGRFF